MTVQQDDDRRWHVKREISLGDMIAIVIACSAVITSYMSLNARVMVVETLTQSNSTQFSATVNELKGELRRFSDKLDRLVERAK